MFFAFLGKKERNSYEFSGSQRRKIREFLGFCTRDGIAVALGMEGTGFLVPDFTSRWGGVDSCSTLFGAGRLRGQTWVSSWEFCCFFKTCRIFGSHFKSRFDFEFLDFYTRFCF